MHRLASSVSLNAATFASQVKRLKPSRKAHVAKGLTLRHAHAVAKRTGAEAEAGAETDGNLLYALDEVPPRQSKRQSCPSSLIITADQLRATV